MCGRGIALRHEERGRRSPGSLLRRVDHDELSERLDAVYRARTLGELRDLNADLPELPPGRAQERAEIAERRSRLQRELIEQTGGSLVLFVLCTAIWAPSGA